MRVVLYVIWAPFVIGAAPYPASMLYGKPRPRSG